MRLGISNLAWPAAHDAAVAACLRGHAVDAVDVAPGRYFPEPATATAADVAAVRHFWQGHGVAITGLQALLFGSRGLNLFGDAPLRAAMLAHLHAVFRIGEGLGARLAVFGSPRQRDRGTLDEASVQAIAIAFFQQAGELAAGHGLRLCLEPNPPRYGANFLTTAAETAALVRAVDHPAVWMQCDLGALHLAGEALDAGLDDWQALVGHLHLSEPDLRPLGSAGTPHAAWAPVLRRRLGERIACIEMLPAAPDDPLPGIEAALAFAHHHYREGIPAWVPAT